jgi:hypothetical protein
MKDLPKGTITFVIKLCRVSGVSYPDEFFFDDDPVSVYGNV